MPPRKKSKEHTGALPVSTILTLTRGIKRRQSDSRKSTRHTRFFQTLKSEPCTIGLDMPHLVEMPRQDTGDLVLISISSGNSQVSGIFSISSLAQALKLAAEKGLHALSVASRQSEPLPDVSRLRAEADRLAATGSPLPRPERFAAYRVVPASVEFWSADPGRLHRRLRYDRSPEGWRVVRLQP